MNRTEIVEKIEEFSRECAKTQYTDTGDVWALFSWIKTELTTAVRFESRGCFVRVIDGALFASAMLADGTKDADECEVTAPESQEFLDEVNAEFGTSYKFEEFAGR